MGLFVRFFTEMWERMSFYGMRALLVLYVSMLMSMLFLSSFLGNYLSGFIGTFYAVLKGNVFFALLAGLAAATGVVMSLFNRPIQRWLHASQAAVTSATKGTIAR